MPTARPTAAAVSALPTWCAPTTASVDRRAALRGDQGEAGVVGVVLGDVLGADQSASAPRADGDHLARWSCAAIAATSGSSAFRIATPPSAAAGSACTSSALAVGDVLHRAELADVR